MTRLTLCSLLIFLIELSEVMIADFIQLKLVPVFLNLIMKLLTQSRVLILKDQDLFALLEHQRFKLTDSELVVILGK